MILAIVCLVMGITGLVKRKISISKNKELRGPWMYAACILLMCPIPLATIFQVIVAIAKGGNLDQFDGALILASIFGTWAPIIAVFVIGFTKGQPKIDITSQNRGFDVMPPPPPPPGN